jgi:hypothetical protein
MLCDSDDVKELDTIYDKGIELLKKFVERQNEVIA